MSLDYRTLLKFYSFTVSMSLIEMKTLQRLLQKKKEFSQGAFKRVYNRLLFMYLSLYYSSYRAIGHILF